jgi:hypothetical protein
MPSIVTANALTDFDMCLAVAQVSIDTQMEYAWKAWKRRNKFQDTINIFKLMVDGKLVDVPVGLSAKFAPLSVSLAVPDGKLGQVQVNLKMESGKVVYMDEVRAAIAEYPIKDWSVSFLTGLDKKPVDLRALQQIDPEAHVVAQEVIQTSGLPESVFSIEYLFLKLTEVDLMLADNKNVKIPANVPSSARNKALAVLNLLLQGDLGEYVLGTVVRRNTKQATPTFALTDFVFDVRPNWSAAKASTLNYLGEFSGRGLPADVSAARYKLGDNWVRPEQLDGTESNSSGVMAISKAVFLEKYLIPKVKASLAQFVFPSAFGVTYGIQAGWTGPEPTRDNLTWTFKQERTGGNVTSDIIKMQLDANQGYELSLTAQPSSNRIAIKGRIWSNVHYNGMTWLAPNIENATEWIYVDGHQEITGSALLTGNSIGTDFNLESKLDYTIGDLVIDRNVVGGFSVVTEAFGKAFKAMGIIANSPQELLGEAQKGLSSVLRGYLNEALARLNVDLTQQTFVPPGGGVFTFQNPCFSNAGDLFFDVIYRAP